MMRLDRLLSTLGLGSRSQVKSLIHSGRIKINQISCTDPARQTDVKDIVSLDDQMLQTKTERHLMMNKPGGLLTAARDSRQETVMNLLSPLYKSCNCMPVGRLDKDTEGLLLFTTDGETAHHLLSPKNKVKKVYLARVSGLLDYRAIEMFEKGIILSDFEAKPAVLCIKEAGEEESIAQVTVYEGKFHQVKRMFQACGHEVLYLKRLQFGSLLLDETLNPGQHRELTHGEWQNLLKECSIDI